MQPTAAAPGAQGLPAGAAAVLVVLMASWGFQLITVKLALPELTPAWQSLIRAVIATACLTAFMLARGERPVARDATLVPGLVVGLLFAVEFLMIFDGLARTSASRGMVFLYTMPFFVIALSVVFLPGERLAARQIGGMAAAFSGVAVAFADGLAGQDPGSLVGDLMLVGAAFLWAATTIVIKRSALVGASASRVLWFQLALSIPVSALAVWLAGSAVPAALSGAAVATMLYQGVWVAFITYVAWFRLIARHSAALVSSFSFLTPLFGVVFGHLILGEVIGWRLGVALVLVIGGLVLVSRGKPA